MNKLIHSIACALALATLVGAASGCHALRPQTTNSVRRHGGNKDEWSADVHPLLVLLYVNSMRGNPFPNLHTVLYSDGHVVRTGGNSFLARKLGEADFSALLDDLKLEELRKLESDYSCPDPNGPWRTFPDGRVVHFTGPSDHAPSWQLLLREGNGYRAISLRGPSGCEPEVFQHAFARLKDFDASPWSPDILEVVLFPDTSNQIDDAVDWPRTWPMPEPANDIATGAKLVRLPAAELEHVRALLGSDGHGREVSFPNGDRRHARWRWPIPDEHSWRSYFADQSARLGLRPLYSPW
jgi:hypothetical protein